MNEREKSDRLVVPVKPPNNAAQAAAEVVEGRGLREGNATSTTRPGPRAGQGAPSALDRVRCIAEKDKGARFTAQVFCVPSVMPWRLRPATSAPVPERSSLGARAPAK